METQKKRCCQCDFIVEENINFCPYCGSNKFEPVDKNITMRLKPEDSPWYTPKTNNVKEVQKSTKILNIQEFYEQYISNKSKGWIIWFLVMNFASAVISLISMFAGNIMLLFDTIIHLGIGILVLRKKNWIAAMGGTIYRSILSLINIVLYQDVSGMLYVIVAIIVVRKLRKLQAEYKEYTISGKLPDTEI